MQLTFFVNKFFLSRNLWLFIIFQKYPDLIVFIILFRSIISIDYSKKVKFYMIRRGERE
jgi:hypothetical protein